jgi:flagellin
MTISIQSSNPALAALEALAPQPGGAAAAGAAAAQLPPIGSSTGSSAAIISVSAGATLGSLPNGLVTAASASDAAVAAGGAVGSLLAQMRQDALTAADPGLAADARSALDTGFKADLATLTSTVASASVDGVNLIDGSTPTTSSATVSGINLSLGGPLIGLAGDSSLSDPSSAAAIAAQLGQAVGAVGQAVGQIAAQGQALNTHLSLMAQANLSLQPALASAVNGGLDADGASLAALQVQQQLSASTGSIASQGPQAILALFR